MPLENDSDSFIPTRASLLSRIKDISGQDGWRDFFETYWKLIYNTARRSGLSDAEAQDVVQETMIGVCRNIPSFRYDTKRGAFKTWLMNLVIWRIQDQKRKRLNHEDIGAAVDVAETDELVDFWEQDWERNLLNAAMERVKNRINPRIYQIFAFCVLQKKGPAETARVLNISPARVYLARHRVSREVAKEVKNLKKGTFNEK